MKLRDIDLSFRNDLVANNRTPDNWWLNASWSLLGPCKKMLQGGHLGLLHWLKDPALCVFPLCHSEFVGFCPWVRHCHVAARPLAGRGEED